MTPACKTQAARMLDLMDHSVTTPCEDFYQYACGGVTDDLFLDPENRKEVTRRLILDHILDLSPEDPNLGTLKTFYDSCTSAEVDSQNRTFWLPRVKAAFDTIDNMTGDPMFTNNSPVNFTQILVEMMKIHLTPIFDLLLDEAEDGTDRFVLKLTPPMERSLFSHDMASVACYGDHLSRKEEALHSSTASYYVNDDYEKYSECIGKGRGLKARLEQMDRALKELGLMHHFNYSDIHSPEQLLVDDLMDTEFLLGDLHNILPKKPDLQDRHLKKHFKNVTLSYLEQKFDFTNFKVDWLMLVKELLGHSVDPDNVTIHIYFEEELHAAFDEIDFKEPSKMRRILLLLLAERLYTDLVSPSHYSLGNPEYCLQVTTKLLGDYVSSLYLQVVPHLQERQQKMEKVIKTNMEAAEKELLQQPNLKREQVEMLLSKLGGMSGEVASPEPSQYLLQEMNETSLSDDFVDNCLILLRRYRSLMYHQYHDSPSSPAVMWSHFLRPFSSSGMSLYASNKFLIPYGAMEAPLFFRDMPDYINYAGIGHMIAHELMHGFDGAGIMYNGPQRRTPEGLEYFVQLSECQSYQYRSQQTLTEASGLKAAFTLGRLPLNEVLAHSGAVRLAWEAYEHSLVNEQKKEAGQVPTSIAQQLPWLDLNPLQLYFLWTAQVHCSATSDTYMLSLMESEHLPNKLKVNLMLQNEPLFTEAFNCTALPHQCPYVLG